MRYRQSETLTGYPRDFGLEVEEEGLGFGEELCCDLLGMDVCSDFRQSLCHDVRTDAPTTIAHTNTPSICL